MGFPAVNGVVATSDALAPIAVTSTGTVPAVATTSFQVDANLDSDSAVGATYNTTVTVYDLLGTPQSLTIQYTNTGTNTWSYSVTLPGSATGSAAATTTLATGTLTFNSSGQLTSPTGTVPAIDVTGLADGAANMSLTWNLNDSSGNPIITQQDTASALNTTPTQNGFAAGALTSYSVLTDGVVQGNDLQLHRSTLPILCGQRVLAQGFFRMNLAVESVAQEEVRWT